MRVAIKVLSLLLLFSTAIIQGRAFAQSTDLANNPFVSAVKNGTGYALLPKNQKVYALATQLIQSKTGSSGDVTLAVFRVLEFTHQPSCGRVAFGLYQESTKTLWSQLGGQINICENGAPPMRICKNDPMTLVVFDGRCKDGSSPIDTPEVATAIQDAIKNGSMSTAALLDKLDNKKKTKDNSSPAGRPE